MNEHFLSFIWQHQLYDTSNLVTDQNDPLTITHPGYLNTNAGPDFSSGAIVIDQIDWRGSIELHVKSSDWYRHKHENDEAYNNVVLHVVFDNDMQVMTKNKMVLPTLELRSRISNETWTRYQKLILSKLKIPCGPQLQHINSITRLMVTEKWAITRLADKAHLILARLGQLKGDWLQVSYEVLMRAWGFHINSDAFQQISTSLPISTLLKNSDHPFRLEALLLGHANLLSATDAYSSRLVQEYQFLKEKYSLTPINPGVCRFLRTRPGNFPTVRLAQLSAMLSKYPHMVSRIAMGVSMKEWKSFFNQLPSTYWQNHLKCGIRAKTKNGCLSKSSIITLFINAVAPLRYAYAIKTSNDHLKEKINGELDILPPENNFIIRDWKKHGLRPTSAFQSQGLLHLYKQQCLVKKCHECHIGIELLKK